MFAKPSIYTSLLLVVLFLVYGQIVPRPASAAAGDLLWRFKTYGPVTSSAAISDSGTIFFGSEDWNFYALNPDGTYKWIGLTNFLITGSPAIGKDGTVYIGSWDFSFYAVTPDSGDINWIVTTGSIITSSAAVAPDGMIYIGFSDHRLYGLLPDGTAVWAFVTDSVIQSPPAVGADSTIFFGSDDAHLYAVHPDGSFKWAFQAGGIVSASPAIGADGTVYIGSWSGRLFAIHPEGQGSLAWAFIVPGETPMPITGSAVLGEDGSVYVGTWDGRLYAFDSLGRQKWSFPTEGIISGSPLVGADGTIYFGSWDGRFYAVNPDGTLKWHFKTEGEIESSPTITNDGVLYFGSKDGYFYALDSGTKAGLAHSFWPKFRRDLHNTGSAVKTFRPGDVDTNDKVNIFDLLAILSVISGKTRSSNADVNADGKTDIFDLLALLKLLRNPGSSALAAAGEGPSAGRYGEISYAFGGTLQFTFADGSRLSLSERAESPDEIEATGGLASALLAGGFTSAQTVPRGQLALAQNYPNPFNPSTTIGYSLPEGRSLTVHLDIYDATGRLVRTLVDSARQTGENRVNWDGLSDNGRPVASGVYLYTLRAGNFRESRKMVLLK